MHKQLSRELERIRRLAKNLAELEGVTVVVYKNDDGTFGFCRIDNENINNIKIIEYITPY